MYFNQPDFFKNLLKTLVGKLIIINIAIFLLQLLNFPVNNNKLIILFGLLPGEVLNLKIWQIFTYMFLHGGFFHLFFNMLALLVFGLQLERLWGRKELFKYYVICGSGAAVFSFLFINQYNVPIIGASGAIFGLFLAYGLIYPNRQVIIFPIPIPIKIKYALIGLTLISLFSSFNNNSSIAHFAHLGGIVIGFVYLKHKIFFHQLNSYLLKKDEIKKQQKVEKLEVKIEKLQNNVDELLEKISNQGLHSLTDKERKILKRASELIKLKDEM